jgi:putative hydrolase of the HAD superfamily
MIKVISFDLDNTLWVNHDVIVNAENACYQWLADNVPKFSEHYGKDDLAELRTGLVEQDISLASRLTELRKRSLYLALEHIGHPRQQHEAVVEGAFARFMQARNQVEVFPEAESVLLSLKKDFQLASLTNGNSDVRVIGIEHWFDVSLSAEEVGRKNPAPDMFETLMHMTGTRPGEIVHVGDHPEDDVIGAASLGIHSIWFNPEKTNWEHDETHCPKHVIQSLKKIPDIISGLHHN